MASDPEIDFNNKPVGETGRSTTAGLIGNQSQAANVTYVQQSSRQGTVVIRATVEHIGLAGDTEMTVTVKWPASTFCVPPCAQVPASSGFTPDDPQVPPNGPAGRIWDPGTLYGETEVDLNPARVQTASQSAEESSAKIAPEQNQVDNAQKENDSEVLETIGISPSTTKTRKEKTNRASKRQAR